jgi:hypothetical protein
MKQIAALTLMLNLFAVGSFAQIGQGWEEYLPTKKLQQENSVGFSSYTDSAGVESFRLWENPARTADGKPLRQRCEIRINDDYTSGATQFEGEFFVLKGGGPLPENDVSIMQVWLSAIISVSDTENGSVYQHGKKPLLTNVKGRWVKLNVIHNADTRMLEVWFDGVKKYSSETKASNPYYHKYGLYNEAGANPEVKWRSVRFFKK